MKNLRKDASLGLILLAAWLIIKVLFQGNGFFMWVLGIAGLVLTLVGFLPEGIHAMVMDIKNKIFPRK